MGQPAWTIADTIHEAQTKLRGNSSQLAAGSAASPMGGRAVIPTRPKDDTGGIDEPVLPVPCGGPQSSPVAPEQSAVAPPTPPETAPASRMAPGLGSFNIDPPGQRSPAAGDGPTEDTRIYPLFKLELLPQPAAQPGLRALSLRRS